MYTQVFGNYLLSKELITREQLLAALSQKSLNAIHPSTLALYYGYISPSELEHLVKLQKEEGRTFSDLAVSNGYLSQEQALDLLNASVPDFLLLGQILLENGTFTYEQFANILADYRCQDELLELEMNNGNNDEVQHLLDIFSILSENPFSSYFRSYFELLFNDFIRMIGDDFTPLPPTEIKEFSSECCITQEINGFCHAHSYICMSTDTAIQFAGRYTGETFAEFNEYVQASLEDFLNLHNGLFIVNTSNDNSKELTIGFPQIPSNEILSFEHTAYCFPICYSFGTFHFILEV